VEWIHLFKGDSVKVSYDNGSEISVSHFDTVEVIEAESQVVLNTLTEHDFQDAVNTFQKYWKRCVRAEGDYFEGDGG
jgi:hypothetical protein